MYEYRVTKYDKAFRIGRSGYGRDEWTSVSDIGKSFDGKLLTEEEYLEVEGKYLYTIERFAQESGVDRVTIRSLQFHDQGLAEAGHLHNDSTVTIDEARGIARLALREKLYCRLEDDDRFFVHFGYDYYMYLGSHVPCEEAVAEAERIGLFVDRDFVSPYHPDHDEDWWR